MNALLLEELDIEFHIFSLQAFVDILDLFLLFFFSRGSPPFDLVTRH
jgi:hypothetical protein